MSINIPLPTLLNRLDNPHPHHLQPKASLGTNCNNPLIDPLQIQPLNAFNYCLQLMEIQSRTDFVCFGEDDLHIDVVLLASLEEEDVVCLESVLEVDADKDLREA